ncbi:right-handed parallel beta-helix repeat-containing protein [Muriicola sp. Z0-33]|uniref:right-handed parallel beta-helix repeat-containing protein n=1 Tax=Muriicola sp. Z0-33 TaxID=2816957 RepID=UPI002236F838|nr:right-handed parallel beta-helix repeat-containing protein [Muriicola sp. Z0-33]MCW5515377.1 right-handed parallel beta-helix repeat-containing protein [Muriicola sp. Z0-33]
MKIGSNKRDFFKILLPFSLLIPVILFSVQMAYDTSDKNVEAKKKETTAATVLFNTSSLEEMLTKGLNQIHRDSVCTMFINNELGTPHLYYVYNDSLSPEIMSDRTYLHVYLKEDPGQQESDKVNFINLDFTRKLKELYVDNIKYYTHKIPLVHKDLDIDKIAHVNTGRFTKGKGKSYEAIDIVPGKITPYEIGLGFKELIISIKEKELNKIKRKRAEALVDGILVSEDDDWVKAKISTKEQINVKSLIRLKGDWTDHLRDTLKWSYKVKLEGEQTLYGMRKFSVQHPIARNYAWEWLYQKAIKENGLLGLRYDFLNVEMQVEERDTISTKQIGVMALEESIDKILIENNQRREGIIISFDESILWDDRKNQRILDMPENPNDRNIRSVNTAPIRVFNANKVLATPHLKKQFDIAKNMLEGVREGKLKVSEVFDVDKLSLYVAISNLFGGHHGLIWHNLRIYYNPVTNKLEPVASDSNSGYKVENIRDYIFTTEDAVYKAKLLEKLAFVSDENFVQQLYNDNYNELSAIMSKLKKEFNIKFDPGVLEHNSNLIKKQIFPANGLIVHLSNYDTKEVTFDIRNITSFPIAISRIQTLKGKALSKPVAEEIVGPGKEKRIVLPLKRAFLNAFVSKKNKKGEFRYPKDIAKINLAYKILGTTRLRTNSIIPYEKEDPDFVMNFKKNSAYNYDKFPFITVNEDEKLMVFTQGKHLLKEHLRIPQNFKITVEEGFQLDMSNNASIISYSPIICEGSKANPIKFYSSGANGGGILISNAADKSVLNYCVFSNLSFPVIGDWTLSGAVNFNESYVEITNSTFEKNRSEDGLNIIRSEFIINGVNFKDTQSDAFDGDFVTGKLSNSSFVNCGNDGIDVSGSNLEVINVEVIGSSDKAISIGEGSSLKGKNIKIVGGEIGVVSKDLSVIALEDIEISGSRLAISAFQKKSEFGPGKISIDNLLLEANELDYLIEENSQLAIDNVLVETKSKKVLELMYGNEYGKSSR